MAAISRWVKYSVDAIGTISAGDAGCKGTRGYSIGTIDPTDSINIGSTTNRLHLSIGGESAPYITLISGANLDPRFIAKDITEKLHSISGKTDVKWTNAICKWENACNVVGTYGHYGNRFKIYAGDNGTSSQVVIGTGSNDAKTVLGFGTVNEKAGLTDHNAGTYNYAGTATVSGTYTGLFDEVYKIVITTAANRGIGTPSLQAGNNYDGDITTGGVFNASTDITYTINIDAAPGATMGAGTGNVPIMKWISDYNDDDNVIGVELLYPDHWYNIGSYGLMVKFSDAVFNSISPAWTIACTKPTEASSGNSTAPINEAQYVWASDRGDMSSSVTTTVSGAYTKIGTRGAYIKFEPQNSTDRFGAGDEFYIYCSGPLPDDNGGDGISSLNYGNVTVSTESDVKCVMFEVKSGAIEVSTVKFGLQSHGTFSHHNSGSMDTKFRFGTVGVDHIALGAGSNEKIEWHQNVAAADIDSDTPPPYLFATKENLSVVGTADDSEVVGNYGLVSDVIFVNILLGNSETGANSSINMRLYFDYS